MDDKCIKSTTYRFAFLGCQIRVPRQLQESFFCPHSLNVGWACNGHLFELDAAALWVKQSSNDKSVQLDTPYDTSGI